MSEDDLRRADVERAYRAHADDVYRVAYAILRDPEAAGDATHDAFARAYQHWEQYDSARPIRPWLQRIVANVARDGLRRQRVRRIAVSSVVGEHPPRATTAASAELGSDPATEVARRELVDDALGSLKPDVRAALVLRHYYGYDYAEIAGILGTSPGNVGSILSRAHASLRVRLGEAGVGEGTVTAEARSDSAGGR